MIGFPVLVEPSSVLWHEAGARAAAGMKGPGRRAESLLQECHRLQTLRHDGYVGPISATRYRGLDSICSDARRLRGDGDPFGCAVVLVHLSDLYRRHGRLGPALKTAQEAYQIFAGWPEEQYKHNQAVVLYALGIIQQLLGSDDEAWSCYERALAAFGDAQARWRNPYVPEMLEQCVSMSNQIVELMDFVATVRAEGGTSAIRCPVFLGYLPSESVPTSGNGARPGHNVSVAALPPGSVVTASVTYLCVDMKLRVGSRTHVLQLLQELNGPSTTPPEPAEGSASPSKELAVRQHGQLPTPAIEPGTEYCILQIPDDVCKSVKELTDCSYALIRPDTPSDQGCITGEFTRDRSTMLRVTYPPLQVRARMVGDEDPPEGSTGTIVGVFKAAETT